MHLSTQALQMKTKVGSAVLWPMSLMNKSDLDPGMQGLTGSSSRRFESKGRCLELVGCLYNSLGGDAVRLV